MTGKIEPGLPPDQDQVEADTWRGPLKGIIIFCLVVSLPVSYWAASSQASDPTISVGAYLLPALVMYVLLWIVAILFFRNSPATPSAVLIYLVIATILSFSIPFFAVAVLPTVADAAGRTGVGYICRFANFLLIIILPSYLWRSARRKAIISGAMPSDADGYFLKGVLLLDKGQAQPAFETFSHVLDFPISNKVRGQTFYNMAICNLRLGQRQIAIENLKRAISVMHSLRSAIAKDMDFMDLHDDEQFAALIK
jgi:tetratricopeptide (TPR) repeat protein